jgi:steroid 5-alpha reductase family enzyme
MESILSNPGLASVLTTTFVATMAAMAALWLLSMRLRNAAIVDSYWGPGFLVITAIAVASTTSGGARAALLLALVAMWSLRLAIYLTWRNHGQGEDRRYAAMRAHHGDRFGLVSAFTVFGLQGVLMWLLSLPLQLAVLTPAPAALGWLDLLGLALWSVGFVFETASDWQLARFRATSTGGVLDTGLWRYTRHPNYFGESLVWWGYGLIALSTPWGPWLLLSPVLMTFLLLRVSGVTLLERDMAGRRPGYAEYVRSTSAFFPRPPRRPARTAIDDE